MSDPNRSLVGLRPVAATVGQLVGMPRPKALMAGARATPAERTVYEVQARLLSVTGEDDGDWHLILRGVGTDTATLIAEVPDPQCSGALQSPFARHFVEVRARVATWLETSTSLPEPQVRVLGVGFFDSEHGQYGAAPNNFELHPVLWIQFSGP